MTYNVLGGTLNLTQSQSYSTWCWHDRTFILMDKTPEKDGRTDGQTDRQICRGYYKNTAVYLCGSLGGSGQVCVVAVIWCQVTGDVSQVDRVHLNAPQLYKHTQKPWDATHVTYVPAQTTHVVLLPPKLSCEVGSWT